MGTLYFVRHGETVWNVENKICGATDSALTEKGLAQARETGKKLREMELSFDEILSSPLSRALDTAKQISEMTGIPYRVEQRLKEQNFGRFESTPRNGEEFQRAKQHFLDRYGSGESMMQVGQRIYNLLDEIRREEGKTYLIVAHNGIARFMESYFHDMTNEEFASFGVKNCEVVTYTW